MTFCDDRGVQHIMHPDLKEPLFMDVYGNPRFLEICRTLLDCQEDALQLGVKHSERCLSRS